MTPSALVASGARHIRRKCWTKGRVYTEDPWCFVHPDDTPSPTPQVLLINMLPGDDWEEVPGKPKKAADAE